MSARRWPGALSGDHPVALPLRLTAVVVLLRPMGPGWIVAPLVLTATLALVSTPALLSPRSWFVVATLVAGRIAYDWPLADNHVYLLAYWCFAVALALGGQSRADTLALASRLLLGLMFAFAVLWKGLLSPDYGDGRFFTVSLLTDVRFEELTQRAGGMTDEQLALNRDALAPLPEGAEPLDPAALALPDRFRALVVVATWGTLAVEGALAVLFLLPGPARVVEPVRHAFLLVFCLVTYFVAPVAGFGWLLLAMGCARCRSDQHALRAAYLAVWMAVLVYSEVPLLTLMAPPGP